MKKINKLAAAMAVALSMTAMPQAKATEIEFHPNGRGDALLFPVFNGYIENYFTIMNNHNAWIQGHLRFRGGAWTGELRDFDVILSPGDVFVFRIADIDGDGWWEIDQSLDIKNFMYTGLGGTPDNEGFICSPSYNSDIKISKCMDPSDKLIPAKDAVVTEGVIEYHKNMGYVEFIGEAVLENMTGEIMKSLLWNPNLQDNWGKWHQTKVFSGRGTNAWRWSDAENNFEHDMGLSDVPNALSGTAFLTIPGIGHGLAYNAEAFVDFRTTATEHRIDNYRMVETADGYMSLEADGIDPAWYPRPKDDETEIDWVAHNRGVILHHEDAASAGAAIPRRPFGDYVYRFNNPVPGTNEDRLDEARISFNNTWGPTLADGDDYNLAELRLTAEDDQEMDDFDSSVVGAHGLDFPNSIAEVEEAIRMGVSKDPNRTQGPQVFSAYYMDGDIFDKSCEGNGTWQSEKFCPPRQSRAAASTGDATTLTTLTSYYLAFFPTKFYYGEDRNLYNKKSLPEYLTAAVTELLRLTKPVGLEVWDIFENSTRAAGPATIGGDVSPSIKVEAAGPTVASFGHELTFLSINDIKNLISPTGPIQEFLSGRVVVGFTTNNPMAGDAYTYLRSWPGLMYTFEWDGSTNLAHFRSMHRMHR
jgi:hypothetical protein